MMWTEMNRKKKIIVLLWIIVFFNLNISSILNIPSKKEQEEKTTTKHFFLPYSFTVALSRKGINGKENLKKNLKESLKESLKKGLKKGVEEKGKKFFFTNNKIRTPKFGTSRKYKNSCIRLSRKNKENKERSRLFYLFYSFKEKQRNEKKNPHRNFFVLKSNKCDKYRNTREGKNEMIRKIKRILKVTKLLIQLNSFKITPNLRMEVLIHMPRPHVRMHMVKNTLMKLAVTNTPFEAIIPYLKESNIYLFIMNDQYISFALYQHKIFNSLYREFKTNNPIKLSIYENTILTKKQTEELINLKTKEVYFATTINKLKEVITNIPASVLQIPAAIARGIYLSTHKEEKQ